MDLDETLLNTKVVYQGKYLRTEERTVRMPDGRTGRREVVVPPDAVGILPLRHDGTVFLVRQYRTALARSILEIPAGILEPGEAPEDTARRECAEEIGLRPDRLESLFSYYHSVGFSTGRIHVFLGQDLELAPAAERDSTEHIEVVSMPFEQLLTMVQKGQIVDSKTLLSVLWYRTMFP